MCVCVDVKDHLVHKQNHKLVNHNVKTETMLRFKGSSLLCGDSISSLSTDVKSRATENMNETFMYMYMRIQISENVNFE